MLPGGVWHFKVHSGTKDGLKYDVYMKLKNPEEMIQKYVANKKLWKKDMSGVDHSKMAAEIFNDVDLEMDCSCPADLYWGPEYIKTQRKAQYGDQENRPPKKRNPKQYGINCKHAQSVVTALPFYVVTLAGYLKKYYANEIKKVEDKVKGTTAQIKKGAEFLSKKQEEKE